MFRHYLVTALRNVARHKLYSFINIAGLAVGLACVILIAVFVRDELSYDKWIEGSENLWRAEITFHAPGRTDPLAMIPMPLLAAMGEQIPEVRSATRFSRQGTTLTAGDRQFLEKGGAVDPNFLQVIKLPLVAGDPRTVLSRPENLVLTQSAARKYFGDADPVGKTLTTSRGGCPNNDTACANTIVTLRVAGVLRDLPHNTQFDFDFLVPTASLASHYGDDDRKNWLSVNGTFGYVVLAPGTDPARVLAKARAILDRSVDVSALMNVRIPGSQLIEPRLIRFADAHLTTDRYFGMRPPGSWTTLYGMAMVGVLILLVACFNAMNLATAWATMRAREISLRKCLGARRAQLVVQFLGESVLMALMALIVAFALVEVLLPSYGRFMGRPLALHYFADWPLTLGVVAITVLAGLISGFYPALILSGFRPANALRTSSGGRTGAGRLRTVLVVLQFAVSIGLGIGALVVFKQIDFARNTDLGFRRDHIVITSTGYKLSLQGVDAFQQALERGPGILSVARSSYVAFGGGADVLPVQRPGDPHVLSPNHIAVSPNYFDFYGVKILAGRSLSDKRADDVFTDLVDPDYAAKDEGHNVMVNAALAKALGYSPADIVGKSFLFGKAHMQVAGVAADLLFEGVRTPVEKTIYVYAPPRAQDLSIRIQPGREQEALDHIARISRSFVPGVALPHTFLDDEYQSLYQDDAHQGQVFAIFVAIAIVIACLGLFGLAAFTAGRRTREIGIRKVFGARDRDVVILLLWQFTIPVLIANLIAWPLAWYYLHDWLQGFAYRISLSPLYFLSVGLAALVIAWATILGHALRVAGANPVHALRHE